MGISSNIKQTLINVDDSELVVIDIQDHMNSPDKQLARYRVGCALCKLDF